jgi:hypothetical protein
MVRYGSPWSAMRASPGSGSPWSAMVRHGPLWFAMVRYARFARELGWQWLPATSPFHPHLFSIYLFTKLIQLKLSRSPRGANGCPRVGGWAPPPRTPAVCQESACPARYGPARPDTAGPSSEQGGGPAAAAGPLARHPALGPGPVPPRRSARRAAASAPARSATRARARNYGGGGGGKCGRRPGRRQLGAVEAVAEAAPRQPPRHQRARARAAAAGRARSPEA